MNGSLPPVSCDYRSDNFVSTFLIRFWEKLPLVTLGLAGPDISLPECRYVVKLRFNLDSFVWASYSSLLASAARRLPFFSWRVDVIVAALELSDISIRSVFLGLAVVLFLRDAPSAFAAFLRRRGCTWGEKFGSSLLDVLMYLLSEWPVSTPIYSPILLMI